MEFLCYGIQCRRTLGAFSIPENLVKTWAMGPLLVAYRFLTHEQVVMFSQNNRQAGKEGNPGVLD